MFLCPSFSYVIKDQCNVYVVSTACITELKVCDHHQNFAVLHHVTTELWK